MNRMKRIFLRASVLFLLLSTLVSCSPSLTFEKTADGYRDRKNGITYAVAPDVYTVTPDAEREYAKINSDTIFYEIAGLPADRFLSTAGGRLLCDASRPMPAPDRLPVSSVSLYSLQSAVSAIVNSVDQTVISAFLGAYANGVFFDRYGDVDITNVSTTYLLTFEASGEYEGITCQFKYLHYEQNVCVIEDIDDPAHFEVSYPGIPVTTHPYEDGSGYYAVYDFGTELLCDPDGRKCCMAPDAFRSYVTKK